MTDIPPEYKAGNDFGFTAVDDPTVSLPPVQPNTELLVSLNEINQRLAIILGLVEPNPKFTKEDADARVKQVEQLVMPLLVNLAKNPEREYILWPKRNEQIEVFIKKLLDLTRN